MPSVHAALFVNKKQRRAFEFVSADASLSMGTWQQHILFDVYNVLYA
jgi:hypothetical protein